MQVARDRLEVRALRLGFLPSLGRLPFCADLAAEVGAVTEPMQVEPVEKAAVVFT